MNNTLLVKTLAAWGKAMQQESFLSDELLQNIYNHNQWFTEANVKLALNSICNEMLNEEKLTEWLSNYDDPKSIGKKVGLIMAGNLPVVGFHDLLCVLCSGQVAYVKLSSKDKILLPAMVKKLIELDDSFKHRIVFTEMLKGADAFIATGSNNSARYFEFYFGKYPNIIRRNRGSVAVITGNETADDFKKLGVDIFSYFGLGCRNVSKLFVPAGYDFKNFFEGIESFAAAMDNTKFKNNYDYNRTLLLMNSTVHLSNDFIMLEERTEVVSPVAMLYYEFYSDEKSLQEKLQRDAENIQCIAGEKFIPFGQLQHPSLSDYADGVDTMKFLTAL